MPSSPATPTQPDPLALGPGKIVGGKYRIDGFLGAGGMGVVFSAIHLELDAPVAIKVVRDEFAANEAIVSRLLFEARAVARMQSVHVVRVLDVARLANGAPYIVMEKLRGADLAALLEERKTIPVAEAVGYLLQACEGLVEAHGVGIVHRDLKPENMFLAATPEGIVLKILDFGISKDIGTTIREGKRTTLTKGGAAVGSPSYMAPEQIRAAPNLDARADIWSLGTILFELLTGRCPFEAETVALMYQKVLTEDAPSLLDFIPDAPSELNTIIRLCLQKDADDRFQTVQELASALRGLMRPAEVRRERLESGVTLIGDGRVRPPGVSLPVKLGLFATATVLAAASVAFWQLQIGGQAQPPASPQGASAATVRPAVPAAEPPRPAVEPPMVVLPAASAASAAQAASAAKPDPSPPAVRKWPVAPRKAGPVSAGARYGL
ncbi:MAG TPA: protein kinase [Polyangiaceae bacterium]|nr:protein kinase [Polyangiaceae bacterium]